MKWLGLGLLALVLIQLIPVSRDNPPVVQDVAAPEKVSEILRRACYDCHSNETRWPWYANVAPVSWLVGRDVHEGRRHLNFSDWARYSRKRDEVWEEVEKGDMPLWFYVPLHADAKLSEEDRAAIKRWALTGEDS